VIIRVHYNRQGAPKGLPWTLHTSKACHAAAHVEFKVLPETAEEPQRRSNPRYFIKVKGDIKWRGRTAIVVPS
jgi:hypothetical protein